MFESCRADQYTERKQMNKDNAKDYLPLVQALAEGKSIQLAAYFHYTGEVGGWVDVDELDTKVCATAYRIKPEPLVIYASMQSDLQKIYSVSNNRLNVIPSPFDGKVRKFVEVIEN